MSLNNLSVPSVPSVLLAAKQGKGKPLPKDKVLKAAALSGVRDPQANLDLLVQADLMIEKDDEVAVTKKAYGLSN